MLADKIRQRLRAETRGFTPPLVDSIITEFGHDPFLILISCLLSLRAKDSVTIHICRDLFNKAKTPQEILAIPKAQLEKIIYKIGFYRNKAQILHEVSLIILNRFKGIVPGTEKELLSIKGVGRKTANLVLGLGFGIPAICVDIHVHRISNRLGLVKTTTPEETEEALKKLLPKEHWIEWNKLLVMWGQNICVPVSPFCSKCAIRPLCKRVGVTKSR